MKMRADSSESEEESKSKLSNRNALDSSDEENEAPVKDASKKKSPVKGSSKKDGSKKKNIVDSSDEESTQSASKKSGNRLVCLLTFCYSLPVGEPAFCTINFSTPLFSFFTPLFSFPLFSHFYHSSFFPHTFS